MALDLDERQRAMLKEMGVQVWLPGTAFAPAAVAEPSPPQERPPAPAELASPVPTVQKLQPRQVDPLRTAPPPVAPIAPVLPATAQTLPQVSDVQTLDWAGLFLAASMCQACGLCTGRRHTTLQNPVDRATPLQADWMVVGDPPDEDEDRSASPFVDQAGILLDNMLKAVGVSRTGAGASGAYLANVVKCRPPHGRIAQPAELAQCAVFLNREIALVQPRIILAMGRFANQLLLSERPELASLPLGKLRGAVYHYQGVPVVVTYHPKVLLRASADKAKAWADLCLAMDSLKLS